MAAGNKQVVPYVNVADLDAPLDPKEYSMGALNPPTSSVDFSGQQALSFRVENLTSDPVSPTVGQIWLRTDL